MTLRQTGGLAALVCGATYIVGFAFLVTLLAPLGFGTDRIDAAGVVAFINARPGTLIAWNSTIYIVNALALAVLVVALARSLESATPGWTAVAKGLGLIWAALVLGAGMVANVAVDRAAELYLIDPEAAAELWAVLHAVELGLGGGNEIAGGAWIVIASLSGLIGRTLALPIIALGLLTGISGLATIVPSLGETAGAIFGLGAIAWFLALGTYLLRQVPK